MPSRTLSGVLGLAVLLGGGVAFAQERGSEAQREACTPDALRLCGQFIPDAGRIESCLRDAGPRLSPACYAVFNPPQDQREPVRTARRQGTARQQPVERTDADQGTMDRGDVDRRWDRQSNERW